MGQKRDAGTRGAEQTVRDTRRATRRKFSAEEKIRIVLEGLRGEDSIAELCSARRVFVRTPKCQVTVAVDRLGSQKCSYNIKAD